MKINHIHQTKFNTCLHCVLAMIVGESEQYVLDWFKNYGPPICDEDAFLFLAHHGFYLASYANLERKNKGVVLRGKEKIKVIYEIDKMFAYLVVDSPMNGLKHAIFWDGEFVYDPLKLERSKNLSDYNVCWVYPLLRTEVRFKNRPAQTANKSQ